MPAPPRRKVKTGCRTCKLRKVKCDEAWPVCQRCQSTGRACDGYGIWGGGNRNPNPQAGQTTGKFPSTKSKACSISSYASPVKPLHFATIESGEKDCFEWFLHRSAKKLQGVFHSKAWTTLLFQSSMTEPAIRHAIIALSSAHKEEVQGLGYSLSRKEYDNLQIIFTVKQYSQAIGDLEPCFSGSRTASTHVLLTCCVLFVWMEFLRGHYTKGILHLENGLNLLQGLGKTHDIQDPATTYVHGWLITIFTRLIVQAKLLGVSNFPSSYLLGPRLQPDVTCFRSIHHARRNLEQIMLRIFDVQEQYEEMVSTTPAEPGIELLKRRDEVQEELQTWLKIYEYTISRLPPKHDYIERFAYWLLRLYYHVTVILAGTCTGTFDESQYDDFQPVFLAILLQSVQIYRITHLDELTSRADGHRDPESTSPNSISDIGWIAPLYFTAIKCRNRRIRHQAVRLLRIIPHKEGIWNATIAIHIARRVIEVEEQGFYPKSATECKFDELDVPTPSDLQTFVLPSTSRLSKLSIRLPDDRAGTLTMKYCRVGEAIWSTEERDMLDVQFSVSKMVRCYKDRHQQPPTPT